MMKIIVEIKNKSIVGTHIMDYDCSFKSGKKSCQLSLN